MPGSVVNAAPSTVLPYGRYRKFVVSSTYRVDTQVYPDGNSQRQLRVATARQRWDLSLQLIPSTAEAFLSFYDARRGSLEPFWFYDLVSEPTAVWDPTGVATVGRITVRFDGPMSVARGMGRFTVDFSLVEIN